MSLQLLKPVSIRTSSISTENLSETKHPLAVIGTPSANRPSREGRETRTATQNKRQPPSFQDKKGEGRSHG